MYKFSDIVAAHLEITNKCQAACPMCPRNIHGGVKNPLIKNSDWTMTDFANIFNDDTIKQFKRITFCGTFGDPILNNDLIKMCEYIKKNSPDTMTVINTNGSARNKEWWKSLINSLTKNHSIFFDLDGVDQKTHSLYRIDTDYNTIINNAKVVIESNGNAYWHFIRFKHNQHQVEDARKLSKKLGFKNFIVKETRRFVRDNFPVLDKKGNLSYYLERPSDTIVPIAKVETIKNYKSWPDSDKIYCYAKEEKEIYIDSGKIVFPCCIIPAFVYTNYNNDLFQKYGINFQLENEVGSLIKQNVLDLISELGGKEKLNASLIDLKSIINSNVWQSIWDLKWKSNMSMCCTAMCSKNSPFIKLNDQFNSE